MITRRAKLQRLLALDSSDRKSICQGESSQSDSTEVNSNYQPLTSTRTFLSEPMMEEANAALAAPLRKKLERLQGKTVRCKDRLGRQRDQENPAASDYEVLKIFSLNWRFIRRSTTSSVRSYMK